MKLNYFNPILGIALFFIGASQTNAQATFDVATSGSTFNPSSLTIDIGDTVRFTNTGGTHNVNGTTGTFPSNPESFGNALGTGWVYKHKFMTAGTYDYRCDQHFGSGMVGSITVVDPAAGLPSNSTISASISIYPIPATGELNVQLDNFDQLAQGAQIVMYDLAGKEVLQQPINAAITTINTAALSNTTYILKIVSDNVIIETRKVSLTN